VGLRPEDAFTGEEDGEYADVEVPQSKQSTATATGTASNDFNFSPYATFGTYRPNTTAGVTNHRKRGVFDKEAMAPPAPLPKQPSPVSVAP